jgi:hypothetical protein
MIIYIINIFVANRNSLGQTYNIKLKTNITTKRKKKLLTLMYNVKLCYVLYTTGNKIINKNCIITINGTKQPIINTLTEIIIVF